jgi:hypothetical protein
MATASSIGGNAVKPFPGTDATWAPAGLVTCGVQWFWHTTRSEDWCMPGQVLLMAFIDAVADMAAIGAIAAGAITQA